MYMAKRAFEGSPSSQKLSRPMRTRRTETEVQCEHAMRALMDRDVACDLA
jgi:hypothetical protein